MNIRARFISLLVCSAAIPAFANPLPNPGFEAAHWLPDAQMAQSLALIPLQNPHTSMCMGLLVLASPDSQRFTADMGTDFLTLISQLASAALVGLLAR